MSSGSYFTIYRKDKKQTAATSQVIASLKNEYYLKNKNGFFASKELTKADEKRFKEDIPILMDSIFKADASFEDERNDIYLDEDGVIHKRLLEFHFCSTFSTLKEEWGMSGYEYKRSMKIITKDLAEKLLQAARYILAEDYSKTFEDVLNNDYVKILGSGYSKFDSRFRTNNSNIYIDKEDDNSWRVSNGDTSFEAEIEESDSDVIYNLKHMIAALEAYLHAESYTWDDEDLVLVYSAY